VIVLLWINIIKEFLQIIFQINFRIYDIYQEIPALIENIVAFASRFIQVEFVINVLVILILVFSFCWWFNRTYANVKFYFKVADMKYSPSWAVVGFFVPVANFYIPYIVGREIFVGSHAEINSVTNYKKNKVDLKILNIWWISYWVMNLSTFAVNRMTRVYGEETIEMAQRIFLALVISSIVTIYAALAAIKLVRKINILQLEKLKEVPSNIRETEAELKNNGVLINKCPSCETEYDLEDYNTELEKIYCSVCKADLKRIK
jgi:hypothetical protein